MPVTQDRPESGLDVDQTEDALRDLAADRDKWRVQN